MKQQRCFLSFHSGSFSFIVYIVKRENARQHKEDISKHRVADELRWRHELFVCASWMYRHTSRKEKVWKICIWSSVKCNCLVNISSYISWFKSWFGFTELFASLCTWTLHKKRHTNTHSIPVSATPTWLQVFGTGSRQDISTANSSPLCNKNVIFQCSVISLLNSCTCQQWD